MRIFHGSLNLNPVYLSSLFWYTCSYITDVWLIFSDDISESAQSNLSAEEWKAWRGLAAELTIVIKGADKGSSVVVWDRSDYLHEASRQLQDQNIHENVKFNENILIDLVAKSI